MNKRKSELRTNPFSLTVGKIQGLSEQWNVINMQPFFPPIECLFKTDRLDNVNQYGIKLNDPILSIHDNKALLSGGRSVEIHPKITMLLSPYKWIKGEFSNLNLPMPNEKAKSTHSKLQSYNNAGYVGSLLSILLSQSECQHFPSVYGAFTGTSKKHTINISDEYEEITERPWFSQNIGKTFNLKLAEHTGTTIEYTRSARPNLELGEPIELEDIPELVGIVSTNNELVEMKRVFEDDDIDNDDDSSSDVSTSYIFQIESVSSSFAEECDFDEEEDDEPFAWAIFQDVPVQVTIMEKLDGTFYDLLKLHTEPEKHFAWIGQIIFALAYAQRNFAFTHNDLHGNNIMYIPTNKEFLYYLYNGNHYALPTYGYLLKIIDFDRGIGSVRLPGMKEPKTFMSDQFQASEEAGGQYNALPFYTNKHSIIKPNPSFDLVRLATSLFWDLFPHGPKFDEYQQQPLFILFIKWMTLEDGSSVLFFKNDPKIDRYIGFSLYKAIARYCKDAIPRKEISELQRFIVEKSINPLVIDI
jgi:hypothetical protein